MNFSVLHWVIFGVFILLMLTLDLGVFHRKAHIVKIKEALIWSSIWITIALLFNLGIYIYDGKEPALQFLSGYVIEKSLSVDNIFVFILIFSYFHVPPMYHHKVLFWGIVGAIVMRAIFIACGITLIERFEWIVYIFGLFLILTGIKMGLHKDKKIHPEKNPVIKFFRKFFPITPDYHGSKFFVRKNGQVFLTPLFLALVAVETTDVIFAVDSIPAILAITRDPFIVYTSNIFAILGLRALYFAVAGIMQLFYYFHYGLSAILVFIGVKMIISHFYKIPTEIALCVVGIILLTSIILSLLIKKVRS